MIIWAATYGQNKEARTISIKDFAELSGIKKPHVCRAIDHLEARNVINKAQVKATASYSFQEDPTRWLSIVPSGNAKPAPATWRREFEKWFENYPNPMYEKETEAIFYELVRTGETNFKELEDARRGYVNHEVRRSAQFRQKFDAWRCMYSTSFLKNDRWREFLKFKGMKKRPKF